MIVFRWDVFCGECQRRRDAGVFYSPVTALATFKYADRSPFVEFQWKPAEGVIVEGDRRQGRIQVDCPRCKRTYRFDPVKTLLQTTAEKVIL